MDRRMDHAKNIVAGCVVAAAVTVPAPQARASAVAGALEPTQILNNIELVAQYLQQLEDYTAQINHYRDMLQNSRFQWQRLLPENVSNVVNGVAGIVRQGQSISYSMANVSVAMQTKFKDWTQFLAANYGRGTFLADYKDWTKTTQDSIASALQGANIQMNSFAEEDLIMRQLEERAATSEGRNDVMRVAGQIASAQVNQLQKLRQLVSTNMQITAAYYAKSNAVESAGSMFTEKVFDRLLPGNGGPTIGGGRVHGPGD